MQVLMERLELCHAKLQSLWQSWVADGQCWILDQAANGQLLLTTILTLQPHVYIII